MLINEIVKILLDDCGQFSEPHLEIFKSNNRYEIRYGKMYDSPNLNFGKLMELSKLFNTVEIDVDDYANAGCKSCDYGSDYGHTIQIYNPTKNIEELEKLVDKDYDSDDIGLILLSENVVK